MTQANDELDELIEAHRQHLEVVRTRERDLLALRDREAQIEVDNMAAQTMVRSGLAGGQPNLRLEAAAVMVGCLETIERSEAPERERRRDGEAAQASHIAVAHAALEEWLDAVRDRGNPRVRLLAQAALLVFTVAAAWAAFAIHWVFLLLLPAVAVPVSLMTSTGGDARWRRLGAQRKYQSTRLELPKSWTEEAVRERLESLAPIGVASDTRSSGQISPPDPQTLQQTLPQAPPQEAPRQSQGDRAAQLTEAKAGLRATLSSCGLTEADLTPELRAWLAKLAEAHRAKASLDALRRERRAASTEVSDAREAVFRFLALHGHAPADGQADLEALTQGLNRVAAKRGHADS